MTPSVAAPGDTNPSDATASEFMTLTIGLIRHFRNFSAVQILGFFGYHAWIEVHLKCFHLFSLGLCQSGRL